MKKPQFSSLPIFLILLAIPLLAHSQDTFTLDPSWAYPAGSGDPAAPGFTGRIHQADKNSGLSATIARGNAQLRGELAGPNGQPYTNLVVDTDDPEATGGNGFGTTPVEPGGAFTIRHYRVERND